MGIADELKTKRAEIGERIEAIRKEIAEMERQQAALDAVIAIYEPDYAASAPRSRRSGRKANPNGALAEVFNGIDRRSFVLRTLREAGRPITTSDCAVALAKEVGLPSDDARLGQIGNKVSQVLDRKRCFQATALSSGFAA
ncbi:hypothetical protein [Rhizobium leguminosarum]|uniref:hypothetical protein n=1 Tax=Rhizobium leguminosarum TaxID=384 RepID=UPI0021BC0DB2|nr:hypothetical protein [Rhizobium leguminosarum]